MGKPLMTQRRGKGNPKFRANSHNFKARVKYKEDKGELQKAEVIDFIDDPARTTLLVKLKYDDGSEVFLPAAEGIKKGDIIEQGEEAVLGIGSILPLKKIPEGYPVFNIEIRAGDGGKLSRSSGAVCYIISKDKKNATLKMPSGKLKKFPLEARATIGNAAGGGRTKKPMLKAGTKMKKKKARGQLYPIVRGVKMNPLEHPYGGKEHHGAKQRKGKGGSPGQHVGSFGGKRTGRKKK